MKKNHNHKWVLTRRIKARHNSAGPTYCYKCKCGLTEAQNEPKFKKDAFQEKEVMEMMTYDQFVTQYGQVDNKWKFDQFKIVCVKCGSDKVEFNGKMENEYGYYGSFDVISMIVIKCHKCGNAFAMKDSEGGSVEYCQYDN